MSAIPEKAKKHEFENRLGQIEELVQAIETMPGENDRRQARELVQTLLELHGAGLNRMLEIVHESGPEGQALINQLGDEPLVSNLLLLHGLHPLDLETRVRHALEEVKPRLGLHGGSVDLVEVTPEGIVRLQLEGNCEGCPSSRVTLKYSIEEALYAAAPDIVALEVTGLVEEHAPNTVAAKFTECPSNEGLATIAGGKP